MKNLVFLVFFLFLIQPSYSQSKKEYFDLDDIVQAYVSELSVEYLKVAAYSKYDTTKAENIYHKEGMKQASMAIFNMYKSTPFSHKIKDKFIETRYNVAILGKEETMKLIDTYFQEEIPLLPSEFYEKAHKNVLKL